MTSGLTTLKGTSQSHASESAEPMDSSQVSVHVIAVPCLVIQCQKRLVPQCDAGTRFHIWGCGPWDQLSCQLSPLLYPSLLIQAGLRTGGCQSAYSVRAWESDRKSAHVAGVLSSGRLFVLPLYLLQGCC
jgi:hypothetical protein